jgi:6-phosphogluconolactonase
VQPSRLIRLAHAEARVFPDAAALMRAGAAEFLRAAEAAVAARGRFTVALAGGSTPRGLYALLAAEAASTGRKIPWRLIHFFFGDERAVLPDHPESNFRMAYEALLSHVKVPRANVHRIAAELPAWSAAEAYEATLRRFFKLERNQRPRFDLVLLGMGNDGHTASLFPGTDALLERRRLVTVCHVPRPGVDRVTLTLPVLNHAREVVFLVSGADKAARVREVLCEPPAGEPLPAQRVRPSLGRLLWLLDEAAASQAK